MSLSLSSNAKAINYLVLSLNKSCPQIDWLTMLTIAKWVFICVFAGARFESIVLEKSFLVDAHKNESKIVLLLI